VIADVKLLRPERQSNQVVNIVVAGAVDNEQMASGCTCGLRSL
jgi:hypothetical protein